MKTIAGPPIVAAVAAALLLAGCEKRDQPVDPAATSTRPEITTAKTGIRMVLVPAGQFVMGSDGGEDDEKPAHTVRVDAFYIDKYELTQKAYTALMGKNPSKFKSPDHPVERVSWRSAVLYCNARSFKDGLEPCYDSKTLKCNFAANGYRLPTEAEWEYACRAGTTGAYSFGADVGRLGRYAWHRANAAKTTHPVGRKGASPWGLCDMHGNVWEWCHDVYSEKYYRQTASDNPHGPPSGEERVLRGGSWRARPPSCRSVTRNSETPAFVDACFGTEAYGFRCVRSAAERGHKHRDHGTRRSSQPSR